MARKRRFVHGMEIKMSLAEKIWCGLGIAALAAAVGYFAFYFILSFSYPETEALVEQSKCTGSGTMYSCSYRLNYSYEGKSYSPEFVPSSWDDKKRRMIKVDPEQPEHYVIMGDVRNYTFWIGGLGIMCFMIILGIRSPTRRR